jgi:hypothetical protein
MLTIHGVPNRVPVAQQRAARRRARRAVLARCLGTVQGWDRAAGHLVINPVAIFR